jgi:mRNA-degrading endonuclease RelE of RelBE toxin-antitoxin system
LARGARAISKRAERLDGCADLRLIGEALNGDVLGRYFQYRVGGFRLICSLQDELLLVVAVRIGNRRRSTVSIVPVRRGQ